MAAAGKGSRSSRCRHPRTRTAKSERSQSWLAQRVFAAWSERVRYETRPWLSLLPLLDEVLIAGGEQGKALAPWLLSREAAAFKKCHAGELDLPEVLRDESAPARAPDRR